MTSRELRISHRTAPQGSRAIWMNNERQIPSFFKLFGMIAFKGNYLLLNQTFQKSCGFSLLCLLHPLFGWGARSKREEQSRNEMRGPYRLTGATSQLTLRPLVKKPNGVNDVVQRGKAMGMFKSSITIHPKRKRARSA